MVDDLHDCSKLSSIWAFVEKKDSTDLDEARSRGENETLAIILRIFDGLGEEGKSYRHWVVLMSQLIFEISE
jgi:hypothetical protein